MKLILIFLLAVTIFQYAHTQLDIQPTNTGIPSISLPTTELLSAVESIPSTTYESLKYGVMYYSTSTMNIISDIISKPMGYLSSFSLPFSTPTTTTTTTTITPQVDTPTIL